MSNITRLVNFLCLLGLKYDEFSATRIISHVEVKNCLATRNTVLIQICNPNSLCMLLTRIRVCFLTAPRKLSKKAVTFRLCFSVMESLLFRRSTTNPRCLVLTRGSSRFSSLSSIPNHFAHYSAMSICSLFLCKDLPKN